VARSEEDIPQSQGSVERSNQDVRDMLVAWMSDSNTKTWSEGLRFVQSKKTRTLHSGIKTSPYEAVWNCAEDGTCGFSLDWRHVLSTEDELEQLFNAGMKNDRDEEEMEEANQQPGIDEDENQTSETSEAAKEKKDDKKVCCVICEKESSGAHKCSVCDQFVHAVCGRHSEDSEGFRHDVDDDVTCNLCVRQNRMNIE
jgi:hypothetical protein